MLIEFENVSKVYVTEEVETHALAGVSLRIDRGDYVSIAGPSGCGKSTLLAIAGLIDTPTSGVYRFLGRDAATIRAEERARLRNRAIGFIFQSFNLIADLTVSENVELPLVYRGMNARERRGRVSDAIARVAMAHRANHYPAQLSGGQQQRVAVARALAGEPQLLLADEPTGNLDTANGESVMQLLTELHADGATIVTVTHDPRFAARAQRTIQLLDGRIVAQRARDPGDVLAAAACG